MPGREKLPSTLERSPAKAQRTWFKTHDHAVEAYGEGERAHRTAFAALQARRGGRAARESRGEIFGTVDVLGASKEHLYRAIARTQ
jgi:hypothetical protein